MAHSCGGAHSLRAGACRLRRRSGSCDCGQHRRLLNWLPAALLHPLRRPTPPPAHLQLLQLTLGDTAELEQQAAGGGGFARVHMAANDDGQVPAGGRPREVPRDQREAPAAQGGRQAGPADSNGMREGVAARWELLEPPLAPLLAAARLQAAVQRAAAPIEPSSAPACRCQWWGAPWRRPAAQAPVRVAAGCWQAARCCWAARLPRCSRPLHTPIPPQPGPRTPCPRWPW